MSANCDSLVFCYRSNERIVTKKKIIISNHRKRLVFNFQLGINTKTRDCEVSQCNLVIIETAATMTILGSKVKISTSCYDNKQIDSVISVCMCCNLHLFFLQGK